MSHNELQPVIRLQDRLSPKKREEVRDNPALIHADSREAITQIDHTRLIPMALDPETPISTVIEIRRELRQTAALDPKNGPQLQNLPTLVINFGAAGQPFTLDVTPPAPPALEQEIEDLPTINMDLSNGFFVNTDPV